MSRKRQFRRTRIWLSEFVPGNVIHAMRRTVQYNNRAEKRERLNVLRTEGLEAYKARYSEPFPV